MISIFPLSTSHIFVAKFQQYLHMKMIRYSRSCGSFHNFLDSGLLLARNLLNHRFLLLSWSHHFVSFTVATITWLTTMDYHCQKWPKMCSTFRKHFPVLSHPRLITGCVTRLTLRVTLVKQELFTLPEHLSSLLIIEVRVTRSLVVYVCFVGCCLSHCTFFCWSLCCLFFDIRILITPLLS